MSELIQEASQLLLQEGGRMTAQRRAILETLDAMSGHPTAEEVYQAARLKDSSLNRSTVYRTLRWLEKQELVATHHFDEKVHQDRFDPSFSAEHYHFRCRSCHTIIEFSDPHIEAIKSAFLAGHGGEVSGVSLVLTGLCEQCLRNHQEN